jgi:hypothetical protein
VAKKHEKRLTISGHKGNANQNHTKIRPHQQMLVGGKKEPSYIAGANAN